MFNKQHLQKTLSVLRIALAMIVVGIGLLNLIIYDSHPELLKVTESLFTLLLVVYVIELAIRKNSSS